MSESADRATEAAQWYTVMTGREVAPDELDRFRAWRRVPENAAEFRKVQKAMDVAGGLAERPAIAALTDELLARYPAKSGPEGPSRRFVLAPLALAVAGLVGVGAMVVLREAGPTYSTKVGGQRLEVLADGSRVRLNTDSKVRVDFREDGERRVVLERGQAFFDVAHDAARPFVVEADGARVRALGTQFDVRRDADAVRVTLIRGRVQVRGGDGEAMLRPGEAVVVSRRGISQPTATDAGAVASWTTGRITLSGVSLRDAVAEVNRYSVRKVVLDAPEATASEKISGQFVAGDVENFVAGAASLYGLKVTSQTSREIRLGPS